MSKLDEMTARTATGDSGICRGQIVMWEGDRYRLLWRRPVDGLAMLKTTTRRRPRTLTGRGSTSSP